MTRRLLSSFFPATTYLDRINASQLAAGNPASRTRTVIGPTRIPSSLL
jgi:hypothetical protein